MASVCRSSACCLSELALLTLFTVSLLLCLVCMLLHFSSDTCFTLLNSLLSQVSSPLTKISSPLSSQSSLEDMYSTFITLLTFSYNVQNVHCACCQEPLNELSVSMNDKRTKGCIYQVTMLFKDSHPAHTGCLKRFARIQGLGTVHCWFAV